MFAEQALSLLLFTSHFKLNYEFHHIFPPILLQFCKDNKWLQGQPVQHFPPTATRGRSIILQALVWVLLLPLAENRALRNTIEQAAAEATCNPVISHFTLLA